MSMRESLRAGSQKLDIISCVVIMLKGRDTIVILPYKDSHLSVTSMYLFTSLLYEINCNWNRNFTEMIVFGHFNQ